MEVVNDQNQEIENEFSSETNSNSNNSKDDNVAAGKSLLCWKLPAKCIINMTKFLGRAKSYEHLIEEDRLLVNLVGVT